MVNTVSRGSPGSGVLVAGDLASVTQSRSKHYLVFMVMLLTFRTAFRNESPDAHGMVLNENNKVSTSQHCASIRCPDIPDQGSSFPSVDGRESMTLI